MKLTNLTTQAVLPLHHDLLWTDEHSWSKAVSTADYSVTGALIVETATKQSGRPITLTSPTEQMAWLKRATVDTLRSWADVAGLRMQLDTPDGRAFRVVFRHHDGALEAKHIKEFPGYDPADYFTATLRLMEVTQ
ncbi:hypothetical protein [Ralstonia solanacearum]|uniref:hypothetical protein n=1 Tax=Ralstonia solanacearum TaxID=305 RepID=UPI0005AC37E3|nr:hypothetical protein [Ralstonia solanacearum]QNT25371.1 hypothetical protein C2I38_25255 [Ralstonia solanacearum]QNT63018.1 hypothetical protein C2L97_25300 [Ralstonia solanacearum]